MPEQKKLGLGLLFLFFICTCVIERGKQMQLLEELTVTILRHLQFLVTLMFS